MSKNSNKRSPLELTNDETVLSVFEDGTYGWYPSLPCKVYLTNKRVVIKALPVWGGIINKIIDLDIPFSVIKADIPLSAIKEIKVKKSSSSISDGVKNHVIVNQWLHEKGDEMMIRIAEVIRDQYKKDVLIH